MSFSTVDVLPDANQIIRFVLLDAPEITDLLTAADPATRVATKDPSDATTPWIRLGRRGGIAPARQRIDGALIDVNCYWPTLPGNDAAVNVSLLARTCRAVLLGARNETTPVGVLYGCDEATGPQDLTDPTREPPAERHVLAVTAFIRQL